MGFRTIFAFLPVLLTAFGPMEGPSLKEETITICVFSGIRGRPSK